MISSKVYIYIYIYAFEEIEEGRVGVYPSTLDPGSRVNEPRTARGGSRLRPKSDARGSESRRAAKKEESEET